MSKYLPEILIGVASPAILALVSWVVSKIVLRFVLPKELKDRMTVMETKFDAFLEKYDSGTKRNKESQNALFLMQDYQFDAMSGMNLSIRELAKSVCNGNKEDALRFCDDVDNNIGKGKNIQRKILMGTKEE